MARKYGGNFVHLTTKELRDHRVIVQITLIIFTRLAFIANATLLLLLIVVY